MPFCLVRFTVNIKKPIEIYIEKINGKPSLSAQPKLLLKKSIASKSNAVLIKLKKATTIVLLFMKESKLILKNR